MGERRNVRLFLRLGPDLNERLRAATRYQGDLSEYITEALVSVDLSTVVLVVPKVSRTDPGVTAVISAIANTRFADNCMEAAVSHYGVGEHRCQSVVGEAAFGSSWVICVEAFRLGSRLVHP
jgi:hypothetical protein